MMNGAMLIETYKSGLQRYSMAELRHQSAPGVWSLGQMLDHLILASLDYFEKVEICAADGEEQTLGKTEAGERLLELGGFPPVKIKLPDGPENNPSNTESKEALLRGLDQVLQKMKDWEERIDPVHPCRKVKHDGFGWLNAREWFELNEMHLRHHLRQKEELEQKAGVRSR
ncbi:DinB family protein [Paenibacillus sp. FSL M7-1455]